jgi:hypothetical protein
VYTKRKQKLRERERGVWRFRIERKMKQSVVVKKR